MADGLERLQKQRAARTGWQNTRNRTLRTAPGRAAFLEKLADEADPDHKWSEAERQAAAEQGLLAHMLKMSALAAEARQAKAKRAKRNGGASLDTDATTKSGSRPDALRS